MRSLLLVIVLVLAATVLVDMTAEPVTPAANERIAPRQTVPDTVTRITADISRNATRESPVAAKIFGPEQRLHSDVVLLNQYGEQIPFWSSLIRNKFVCIAVLSTASSAHNNRTLVTMKKLRALLAIVARPEDLVFCCLTDHSTQLQQPELLQLAEKHEIFPQHPLADYHICSGAPEDMKRLQQKLGLRHDNEDSDQNPLILLGNQRQDRWSGISVDLPLLEMHRRCLNLGVADTTEVSDLAMLREQGLPLPSIFGRQALSRLPSMSPLRNQSVAEKQHLVRTGAVLFLRQRICMNCSSLVGKHEQNSA